MSNDIIFVGGSHGVGKSTLCADLARTYRVDHVKASALIRAHRTLDPSKAVDDVRSNQELLISAIEAQEIGKNTTLLDGHFCLFGSRFEIQKIPASVFDMISPRAIILVSCAPEVIMSRIQSRGSADPMSLDDIRSLQIAENHRAEHVSKRLQCDFFTVCSEAPTSASEVNSLAIRLNLEAKNP